MAFLFFSCNARDVLVFTASSFIVLHRFGKSVLIDEMARRILNSPFWTLLGLCVLNILVLALAYQTRLPMTLRVSGDDWLYQNRYLENFGAPAIHNTPRFRYTTAKSTIHLPALGQTTPLELWLHLNAWSPEGAREVTLALNNAPLRTLTNADWKNTRTVITETARLNPNHLSLTLATETFVPHEYDANNPNSAEIGAAVESLTLVPRVNSGGAWGSQWTTPAWEFIAIVSLLVAFAYAGARVLAAPRVGIALALAVTLFFAFVVALTRIAAVAYLAPVIGMVLIALLGILAAHAEKRFSLMRRGLILGVVLLAWSLRLALAVRLPLSGDEQIYVPVSARYAELLGAGYWFEILTLRENFEHPIFTKLLFGVGIFFGNAFGMVSELLSARLISVGAAALLTALLAFVNPIAAAIFAVHSIQIHYASQAYLESLPALMLTLAMISFERARTHGTRWLMLSAMCLGLTAASKYIYAVGGLALVPFLLSRYRRAPIYIFLYGALALLAFLGANPILWTNPVGNFLATLTFHRNVSDSELVSSYARPFYWHLVYLTRLAEWDAGMPYFSFDTLIFFAGILGLPALWQKSRVYLAWFVVALIFLLLWNTKWEQYALTLITPLCLSAGVGLTHFGQWLGRMVRARQHPERVENLIRQ